jgi:TIR domain
MDLRIAAGDDFVQRIHEGVGSCDALLVVIGPHWASSARNDGSRRLDDADDFVRLELTAALHRTVKIVPALVGGARMPTPEEVPEELAPLTRRQAVELSDSRWQYDVDQLIKALHIATSEAQGVVPPMPPPTQSPIAAPPPPAPPPAPSRSRLPMILIPVAALVVAGVIAAVLAASGGGKSAVTLRDWATRANQICAKAFDQIHALHIGSDLASQIRATPQTARIELRANEQIVALNRPPDSEAKIRRLLALASEADVTARELYAAYAANDAAASRSAYAHYQRVAGELRRVDGELGAIVCAAGP